MGNCGVILAVLFWVFFLSKCSVGFKEGVDLNAAAATSATAFQTFQIHSLPSPFGQIHFTIWKKIHFTIWTNTFYHLDKYFYNQCRHLCYCIPNFPNPHQLTVSSCIKEKVSSNLLPLAIFLVPLSAQFQLICNFPSFHLHCCHWKLQSSRFERIKQFKANTIFFLTF